MLVPAFLRKELLQLAQPTGNRSRTHGAYRRRPCFEPGKQVCFFTQDASGELRQGNHGGRLHYFHFTGTVSFVDGNTMVVALPDTETLSHLRGNDRVGAQLYLDETTYRLMFEALDRVSAARHGRLAELRDIFHGTAQAGHFTFQPVRFPWLNPTQETAVNEVLRAKDVMIVHGLREQARPLPCGSHLRDAPPREPSIGVRTK